MIEFHTHRVITTTFVYRNIKKIMIILSSILMLKACTEEVQDLNSVCVSTGIQKVILSHF